VPFLWLSVFQWRLKKCPVVKEAPAQTRPEYYRNFVQVDAPENAGLLP
jgi:hypothetical protein